MGNKVAIDAVATDHASNVFDRLRDKIDVFKKQGATGFGLGIGAAVGEKAFGLLDRAAGKVVDGIFGTIDAASDLNETMSKAEVIFEGNSDAVDAWASKADRAFGQSKKAALDAAAGFAGLFQTVGVGLDQSTTMSKKLTELGSDLASFFNSDVGEALAALKSGLNGESEPLRRFNVFLSETAVNAKLAQMGVQKVNGQFTEGQKATARYQLILEQTGKAQGDFARTADQQANSARITAAEMENLAAEVGDELLPVVRDLTKWARDDGVPALKAVVETLKVLGGAFGEATPEVQSFREEAERTGLWWQVTGQQIPGGIDNIAESAKNMADGFTSSSREFGRGMSLVADRTGTARGQVTKLNRKVDDLVSSFQDAKTWAEKAGDAIAESSYGPEELALKFVASKDELTANQRELAKTADKIEELKRRGDPVPLSLKQKFNDQRIAVNESKQEVIRLGYKLEGVGGISYANLRSQFTRLGIRIDTAGDRAAYLYEQLTKIRDLTDLGTAYDNQTGGKHRAIGGQVQSGDTYIVGEKGPELFTPSMSGYIIPNDQLQGGSGSSMVRAASGGGDTFVFQFPNAFVLTPGAGQQIADAIGPVLTAWQQKRQLIAPARR